MQYECFQTAYSCMLVFLSNCCILFVILMMAYDSAETLNKIMCLIFMAILFAIWIYGNSVHCIAK